MCKAPSARSVDAREARFLVELFLFYITKNNNLYCLKLSDHNIQISLTEYLFNSDDCACGDGDKNQRPYHILYFFSETRNMGSLQFRFTGSTHSSPAICAECNVKTTTNLTKVATPFDV